MAELIAAITKAGTVNLNRLAPHIESDAKTASVHRRLERFFSEVRLNDAEVARATVATLGLCRKPWHLAMDRANWKLGRTDLNVLVLSVAVNQICVPLLALASRTSPKRALALYRKRWKIGSLFGALKTRGFNLEATHMADPAKLSTLIALLTLAAALPARLGLP
jgi:hypothetical protein